MAIAIPDLRNFVSEIELRDNNPTKLIGQIKEAIAHNKIVKLIPGWHISELREFYDFVAEALGTPLDIAEDYAQGGVQTGGRWMEIRYDDDIPDMVAYRHSKNGQPLHTDESYISDPCDIMVFYCVNKAVNGGETVFVDGPALVERLRLIDPELLERLISTDVPYEKAGNRRVEKIIELSNPLQPQFNYNYYCLSETASEAEKQLNQDFFEFLELNVRGSYLEQRIGLNPGEGVLWWDHFLLHGRTPFDAKKTNDRFIWKTGVKWSD